ncbi:MAG: DUF2505 family protein [Microthrixaceae bacterium]
MRFEVQQRFSRPAAAVAAVYSDPSTYERLPEFGRISRPDVLGCDRHGSVVTLRLHYRFVADLPAAALAVIEPAKLTWVEETRFDLGTLTAVVRLLPDHYPQKMSASARTRFVDEAPGSTRSVEGDLRVRVPLVGGRVERVVIDGLREHLTVEARLVEDLLTTG